MNLERASKHLKGCCRYKKKSDGRVEEIACVSDLLFDNAQVVLKAEVASEVETGQLTY